MKRIKQRDKISRRSFLANAGGTTGLLLAGARVIPAESGLALGGNYAGERKKQGTPLGSLYPFLRDLQKESLFKLSFLQSEFTEVESWKKSCSVRNSGR